eukprot:TRINITY_DN2577_c0_g1_i1.p1 TRINITY_DN2577_c0_g1~~TRINITY_DN2577_c0_g1_i1.p1  ORF type:complete len:345 (+),score=48.21 TRINITY_DN2577_c0_g1_i1:329-1363(+)
MTEESNCATGVGERKRSLEVPDYHPRNRLSPTQLMVAASVGGTITGIIATPLDVVKNRLQAQRPVANPKLLDKQAQRLHLNNTFDAFYKISRYEGVSKLWRGMAPTMVMSVPATAFYFTAYERLKSFLSDHLDETGVPHPSTTPVLLAGAAARTMTVTLVSPIELIRTYVQSNSTVVTAAQGGRTSMIGMLSDVVKHRGYRGLWAGLGPTLMRDAPFSAIYWAAYEGFKNNLLLWNTRRMAKDKDPIRPFLVNFASGFGGGVVAAVTTNPLDVVKTRRQMYLTSQNNYPVTTLGILRKIRVEEGWIGFTQGMLPRAAKVAPACAIMISSYEFMKRWIGSSSDKR